MSDENAVIEAAEAIVRDAVNGDPGQLLDALDIPMRLAGDQLNQAAYTAQEALETLYWAAVAYAAVQADTHAQVAALELSGTPEPAASPRTTGVDGDLLVLHGHAYASHHPAAVLVKSLSYVLNEVADLPAGARFEVRLNHYDGGE